ncbi:hypothetical protein [Phyllobacterium zundukense]|uniref:Uncharacterized protein n=1 Tax=Phyllobacterium zundukense TaxID=1867719 RepID=A0ACD4CWW2_9HYPH|nr:hypothetical protein [Phyllobacterium zundukense]UXN58103.1 hypothetical protein N8E88_04560 [Phyllobacterium zundukense]
MSESNVIAERRKVVTDQIARLREQLTALETELVELDFAENIIARLVGKEEPGENACYEAWRNVIVHTPRIERDHAADFACVLHHKDNLKPHIHLLLQSKAHSNRFVGGSPGWDVLAKKGLTLPEKIEVAMRYAHQNDVETLAPKEIENYIVLLFGEAPEKQNVNSVVWRMAHKGAVCKADDAPKYWLPQRNKAADSEPREGASAALVSTRAKGREAVPGGGT